MDKLLRTKIMLAGVAAGLFVSGVTVWPVIWELKIITQILSECLSETNGLLVFLSNVRSDLIAINEQYPFIMYGYDWLAFAHIVLAIMFAGAIKDPVRNIWIVQCGLIMCGLVPFIAIICIPIRGIPSFWIIVDCLFSPFAALPLLVALRDIKYLENNATT